MAPAYTRFGVGVVAAGALTVWVLWGRKKRDAAAADPAVQLPLPAKPVEPPLLCAETSEARPAPASPTGSVPAPWPSIVHVLHDEGLAAEVAEQLAASPTLPRGVQLTLWNCARFKQIAWTGAMRHTVVFIVSTSENEQPTEEAGACVRYFMRREHADGMFANKLAYAVLGLGDSNLLLDRQTTTAKDCNQVAQKLDARLAKLGGTAICARGEADDRTGNMEIEPWLRTLERALEAACGEHVQGCSADCCCNIAGRPRIRVPARRT